MGVNIVSIRFIYGRAGTGKSEYCIESIKKKVNNDIEEKLILIVPEQYTFNTENKVLEAIGEKAFLKVEVLSFKKMANEIFEIYGGRTKSIINQSGKKMLINKVLNENMDKLDYFKRISREQGFNDIIVELIAEFKKYNVDVEKIKSIDEQIDDEELKIKLKEIGVIFEAVEEKMHVDYIDSEDELAILYKKLEESNEYDGAEVWIDEFTTFTPQQMDIIKLLAKRCKRLNITLTNNGNKSNNNDVFLAIENTENRIIKMMQENNIAYDKNINLNRSTIPYRFEKNEELAHIEHYFYEYPLKKFSGENNNKISLYKANNIYDEVENVAKSIIKLVRDKKYRYKNISVVCRNIEDYQKIMAVIFNEYSIPYFLNKKLKLVSNPLIVVITSAFEISLKNWSYESVFKYLKSGLIDIETEYIDILENFVLEHGIRGKRWTNKELLDDVAFKEKDEKTILISEIMDEVRRPLINFHNKIKGKHKVEEICKSIYELLIELNVFAKMDSWIENFEKQHLESKVKEYEQVEKIVIDTLDQAVSVIGKEELEVSEFFKILDSGFNNEEIGVIPVALDQINVGDVARIKGRDVKVLYVVGLNDGVFPSSNREEGIISDRDREVLDRAGMQLASTTRAKMFEEEFLVYTALTIASEILILSYPISDFEGKSLRPSIIISKFKRMFPKLIEESFINREIGKDSYEDKIIAPIPSLNELILVMRKKFDNEQIENYWNEVYNWFERNDDYKEKIRNIFDGLKYSNLYNNVEKNKLKQLYMNENNKLVFSISRLEQYANCPFSYFTMYGLKAKNRKIYEFTPPDLGSFVHEILDLFTNKVKDEGILWSDLDNKRCRDLVSELIDAKLKEESGSILNSSKKYKYLASRFKRVISKSAAIISEQIERGSFEVFETEFNFGNYKTGEAITLDLDNNEKVYLQGRIDRIDKLDLDNETYVRIVDYKTGSKKFDLNEVYYGLQIQLLVYLDAIIKNSKYILKKQAKPGAILYFKVDDPIVKSKRDLSTEEVEKEVLNNLKLKGLVLKDAKVVKAMDNGVQGFSLIIPAGFKKDGSFTAKSDVVTEEEFDILRTYVNEKMKELCNEMLSGEIKIQPIKKSNNTHCEYCEFDSICQFDTKIKDNKYKLIKNKSKDDVMNLITSRVDK